MNELLLGLLSALLATNQVVAISNVVAQKTGVQVPVVNPDDPVEREYQQLLANDDQAQEDVDEWIKEAESGSGASLGAVTLNARIRQRFEEVIRGYEDFLRRHPKHTRARLAFGSLLSDLGRHDEAVVQWERARELDPENPATWNNLADHFSHFGPTDKCIRYFAKAVELSPKEPVYRYNLASAVAAFRLDAQEIYGLPDDQAVLRKAIELYRDARAIAPNDFKIATDLAQMFYYVRARPEGDKPPSREAEDRVLEEGLAAWRDAEKLATSEPERQGVALHMARLCGMYGRFEQARQHLNRVTEPGLAGLKLRISRSIDLKEEQATKAASGAAPSKSPGEQPAAEPRPADAP